MVLLRLAVMLFAILAPAVSGAAEAPAMARIAKGAKTVLTPQDDMHDGILTVYDNNLYVQCLSSHYLQSWRCEAAGLEGEPWLSHILTAERQGQLISLGFAPDAQFGNFVATLPKTTAPDALAGLILRVLTQIYGTKAEDLTVHAERVKSRSCHPRMQAGVDGGGSIKTPHWGFAQYAKSGCGMKSNGDNMNWDDENAVMPRAAGINLDARYAAAMTIQLQRLENIKGPHIYTIFEAGPAYVQCKNDVEDNQMYCEAASDDAVGRPLERILTSERKAKLVEAGFEPPGKVMNFRRFYPRPEYDAAAVAKALLDVLRNAYGYEGAPALAVRTETGEKRPLLDIAK